MAHDYYDQNFEKILRGRLDKEIGEEMNRIVGTNEDLAPHYKRIGKVDGLKFALALCTEVKRQQTGD